MKYLHLSEISVKPVAVLVATAFILLSLFLVVQTAPKAGQQLALAEVGSCSPYANRIISSSQVSNQGPASNIFGAPDRQPTDFDDSNGTPGYVTVGFDSNLIITDGPGDDIEVHLYDFYTPDNEGFEVLVAGTSGNFISLGSRSPASNDRNAPVQLGFNLQGSGISQVTMVQIKNLRGDDINDSHEGPDIDAIKAVNFSCDAPTQNQCSDGIDNDGDDATDYPNDFSCSSATDNDETNPKAQCQDGLDNDNDNLIDYPNDPGCSSKQDNDEFNQTQQNLQVSCQANPNPANTNQPVTFEATATGGSGNYSFTWAQACTGYSQSCTNTFQSQGTPTAFVTVTSPGSQPASSSCWVTINPPQNIACSSDSQCGGTTYGSQICQGNAVYQNVTTHTCVNPGTTTSYCAQPQTTTQWVQNCGTNQTCQSGQCVTQQQNLQVSCYVNPSSAQVNQNVAFNATASGGTGSYSYNWSGACTGSAQNCSRLFTTTGAQMATVMVTSGSMTQSAQCSANITGGGTTCTPNHSQRCDGNAIYWYDSCGNRDGLIQQCPTSQTCSNNKCVNQGAVVVTATKMARNLSKGLLTFATSTSASPGDVIEFQVTVQNNSSQAINYITVKDTLPTNLTYYDNVKVDGVLNSGNLTIGLSLGSLNASQSRVVTYQVQVAPAQNFNFGTTTLTNSAFVAGTDSQFTSQTASASVVVTKSSVEGVTNVPTGWGDNGLADSFFLPLLLALGGVWAWKSKNLKLPQLVQNGMARRHESSVQKTLAEKISEIRNRESR